MAVVDAVVIALALVVVGVMASKRLNVPYTTLLVVIGIILTAVPSLTTIELTPRVILLILLPPLLFEASFNLPLSLVRRDLPLTLSLTVPGVVIGALVIAGLLHLTLDRPFSQMFVFGALIAATDPISVLAIFRRLGAPRRLAALVESESLLNDGTAIVLFGIALTIVDEGGFTIAEGVFDFVRVAGGGVLLGLAVGYLAVAVIRRIDDHLLEITITTLVAFGTNLLAEQMHVSGVLGIVVAGLFLGQQRTTAMSPTTRVALDSFWEYVGFVGNAFIFLLIGQRVAAGSLLDELPSIAVAIVVVLVSRALIVAAANAAVQPWKQHVPWRWTPLVWWGGVRGAVALALALALPASVSSREWIQTTTFGIVIFSLLVQGLTIKPLLMRLGIAGADGVEVEADRHSARIQAYEEALRDVRLQAMQGALSESLSLPLAAEFQRLIDDERDSQRFAQTAANTPAANQLIEGRRHALLAARQQMFELWRQGRLSDDALLDLTDEINAFIDELDRREPAPSPQ